jgi:DNA polymerase
MSLRYPDIQSKLDEKGRVQWTYAAGNKRTKLYGGKIAENVTQAVARVIMTDGMLRIQPRYRCAMTSHDEGTFLVPDREVEEAKPWIKQQMTKEPKYMKGLPLGVTVGEGKRYGDAK